MSIEKFTGSFEKRGSGIGLKRTGSRYIMIRENIHDALDLYTMALYMTFRYESDFTMDDAVIKRSSKYLYEKSKISRRQFFISLTKLEEAGLVLRDSSNQFNSISTYHVAQELGYFNTNCGGVHDVHQVVHHVHTNHYSLPITKDIYVETPVTEEKAKPQKEPEPDIQPYVDVWNEETKYIGCPPTLANKENRKAISRHLKEIKVILEDDKIKLTPGNFRVWLKDAIRIKFHMLTQFKHPMHITLRPKHFEQAMFEIKRELTGNEQ